MIKHSFSRWLVVSAIVGLAIPIAILLAQEVISPNGSPYQPLYLIMLIAWPSSIGMMATDGIPEWSSAFNMTLSICVLVNILLYSAVGSIIWWIKRGITRIRTGLPRR
jgi:hypothetical protein